MREAFDRFEEAREVQWDGERRAEEDVVQSGAQQAEGDRTLPS